MATEVQKSERKICEEEVAQNNVVSECMLETITGSLNSLCDCVFTFEQTTFTSSGAWIIPGNLMWVMTWGVGGGGGSAGATFFGGLNGVPGSVGGATQFDGITIGSGGAAGTNLSTARSFIQEYQIDGVSYGTGGSGVLLFGGPNRTQAGNAGNHSFRFFDTGSLSTSAAGTNIPVIIGAGGNGGNGDQANGRNGASGGLKILAAVGKRP